jgi:tagaturonate reductase
MQHELVGAFIRQVVLDEIVPSLDVPAADAFALAVLERFANPFIQHALFDITLQCTAKLRVRVVPSIVQYARRQERAPSGLALGFAAYILFMRGELQARRREAGLPVPADDGAPRMHAHWASATAAGTEDLAALTRAVCADTILWDTDLTQIPGFTEMVFDRLAYACRHGVPAALDAYLVAHAQQGGER